jgi:hypothetical protein
MALKMYRTTKRPTVLSGPRPAQPWKVKMLMIKVMANIAAEQILSSQTLKNVPSS